MHMVFSQSTLIRGTLDSALRIMPTFSMLQLFIQLIICQMTLSTSCDDVSKSACEQFDAHYAKMCKDSCLSSFCPRTCNRCELSCYSCFDVRYSTECNTTIQCPSVDHKCIMVKSYDNNFQRVYKLGCAVGDVCDNPASDTTCCNSDLCNGHFVPSPPSPTTQSLSVEVLIGKRQTTDPACAERLPSACAVIVAADPSVCNNDCLATRCPVACGRCKACYSCDFVQDIQTCNQTAICQQGEVCYASETISPHGEHGYRLGCTPELLCEQISSISSNAFGKRFSLLGVCCNESSCNKNFTALTTTVTTTTTTATTTTTDPYCNCQGHDWSFSLNGKCYFLSYETIRTKSEAEAWCSDHCGRLPDVTSGAELISLEDTVYRLVLKRMGPDWSSVAHSYTKFYMDAVYDAHRGGWMWKTTGQPVSRDMMGNTLTDSDRSCPYSHGHNSGLLESSFCFIRRQTLCVLR